MPTPIYVEAEENDNCYAMPLQLFEARADPVPIENVRLFEPGRPHGVYEVTGWSSDDDGSPCPAMYVPVSDSGQAEAHLISRRRLGCAHEAVWAAPTTGKSTTRSSGASHSYGCQTGPTSSFRDSPIFFCISS